MQRRGPIQWGFAQLEWLDYQFRHREKFGHQCFRLQLPPDTSDRVVRQAVELMVERHETLRTTFGRTPEGDPEQVVSPPFSVEVLRYSPDSGQTPDEYILAMDKAPFRVDREFPFRVARVGDTLNLVLAHIAIDGWSAQILEREFDEALTALRAGRVPDLPEVGPQPLDQAGWERSDPGERLGRSTLAFWRDELLHRPAGFFPVPVLPEQVGYFEVALFSPAAGAALRQLSGTHSMSPNAVFAGVVAVVLAEMFDSDLVPMTATWAARERARARDVVGSLFRDVIFTLDVTGRPPLPVVLKQAYQRILRAGMHSQFDFVAFTELEVAVGVERGAALRPGVFVNFRPFDDDPGRVADLPADRVAWDALLATSEYTTVVIPPAQRGYELHIVATPTADGLAAQATGSDAVFTERALRRLLRAVEVTLVGLVLDGDVAMSTIGSVLADSRVRPGEEWAHTDHTRVNLRVVEQILCAHPAVRSARVSVGGSGLVARVEAAGPDLTPVSLRRAVMSRLDRHAAARCPDRFEIHLDGRPIAQGNGRPTLPLKPVGVAEQALHRAVMVANDLSVLSMGDNYVTAGGRLDRAPRVNDLLAAAGFTSLSYEDYSRPWDLTGLASVLTRQTG